MKRILWLLLLCGAACAHDNVQSESVGGAGTYTFDLQDHNYGRGNGLYGVRGFWFTRFGAPIAGWERDQLRVYTSHPDFIPGTHQENHPDGDTTFHTWNNAQTLPLILSDIAVDVEGLSGGSLVFSKRNDASIGGNYLHLLTATFASPGNGVYTGIINYRSGGVIVARTLLTIVSSDGIPVPPPSPVATLSASPSTALVNQNILFTPTCNLSATFSYNYGDGNNGSSNTHSYAAAGTYTCIVTAVTTNGNATAQVNVLIYGLASVPAARFNSDIMGGVGRPMLFDASPSTDKENRVVSFSWSFGDGSDSGAGQVISHVYDSVGTYTVTLTITDSQGLTHQAARDIEVVSATDYDNSELEISFDARYSLSLGSVVNGRDFIKLSARLNVGTELDSGTNNKAVSVTIGSKTYSATMNKRGIATATGTKFRIRSNIPKEPRGTVVMQLVGRGGTGLGGVLNTLLGSLVNDQVNTSIQISIGSKSYSVTMIGTGDTSLVRGTFSAVYE